jgi:TPP-dependent pyruvate/acetoin dehydrogenase alpha subunit
MSSAGAADVSLERLDMSDPEPQPAATSNGHPAHVERVRLMLLARALERRAVALASPNRGAVTPFPVGGSEAFAVGSASALGPGDRLFAPDLYLSAHLARGLEPDDFLARRLGGRCRSGEGLREPGSAGWTSSGKELIELAAGAALALRLRDDVGLVSMALVPADAYASGMCDRALEAARFRELPLVVMVEAGADLQASGPALEIWDSTDVELVLNGAAAAVAEARAGYGPETVICRRPR